MFAHFFFYFLRLFVCFHVHAFCTDVNLQANKGTTHIRTEHCVTKPKFSIDVIVLRKKRTIQILHFVMYLHKNVLFQLQKLIGSLYLSAIFFDIVT